MLAWVFFRAENLPSALSILQGLSATAGADFALAPQAILLLAFASLLALFAPNSLEVAGYSADTKTALPTTSRNRVLRSTPLAASATAIMLACGVFVAWKPAVFIYFNF